MLDHAEIVKTLVNSAGNGAQVTVREANFGYVIRSQKTGIDTVLRDRVIRLALVGVWLAVAGIWLLRIAGPGFLIKSAATTALLALACLAVRLARRGRGGYELHVDTSRRELRSTVVSRTGESWVHARARFSEVIDPVMRRGKSQSPLRSLNLRIAGRAEPMQVAVGDEATLLAIHDRLMRDLRPLEERLASYAPASARRQAAQAVFPQLGPDEIAA